MGNHVSLEEKLKNSFDDPEQNLSRAIPASEDTCTKIAELLARKSKGDGDHISRWAFERYFSSAKDPTIGDALFDYVHRHLDPSTNAEQDLVHKDSFLGFCIKTKELITEATQVKFYLSIFSEDRQTLTRNAFKAFLLSCFLLESEIHGSRLDCDPNSPTLNAVLMSVVNGCMSRSESLPMDTVYSWIKKTCPNIHLSIHHFLYQKLGTVQSFPFDTQSIGNSKGRKYPAESKSLLQPPIQWILWKTLPALFTRQRRPKTPIAPHSPVLWDPHAIITNLGPDKSTGTFLTERSEDLSSNAMMEWDLLYDSSEHGLSMNRVQHHVFSYRGPTLMLVKTDTDVLLCVGIDHEWRERAQRWGGDKCIVLQITPSFRVFEVGEQLIYFNLTTRGYPLGLHVGQNPKSTILELDQDLTIAKVKKIPYMLETLEVWGCAGSCIKEEQIEHKKWEFQQVERQQKVNLNAVAWEENPDRYILELAGRPSYSRHFKK